MNGVNQGARQVPQKSLVCWAITALPYNFIVQNTRNILANPSLSLSFQSFQIVDYNFKIR